AEDGIRDRNVTGFQTCALPIYIFTNDNVVNGDFSYTFASEKSMYTTCNVMFDDEQNMYQQDVEPVFDREATLRFGNNVTSITARSEERREGHVETLDVSRTKQK